MHKFLIGVYARLDRAEQLQAQIKHLLNSQSTDASVKVQIKLNEDKCGFEVTVIDFKDGKINVDIGLILSECMHHLRSSLDNLVFALARLEADPPPFPKRLSFPIHTDHGKFKKDEQRCLEQLSSQARDLIAAVQPFRRGKPNDTSEVESDPLLAIQHFSNSDKHHAPIVSYFIPDLMDNSFSISFETEEGAQLADPNSMVLYAGAIENGVVLMSWKTPSRIASVEGEVFSPSRCMLVYNGNSVEPLDFISKLSNYTRQIVDLFRNQFP